MSTNAIYKFLRHEVSLPVETAAYAGIIRTYEEKKSKVYEVLSRHMQDLSFAFSKDIKASFDYFIEGEVQSLIRLGVYNVTASAYVAENEAYNQIDDIAMAGARAVSEIELRELDRLMQGVNAAESEAMTEIKPSRTAFITNSFISSVIYAATETLSENHQMQKAQQKYNAAIQRLASDQSSDREIAKRLREIDYPAAKECIDNFFDTLRSQTLGYMEENGLFDYSSMQSFDKEVSCELLTYYPSTQSIDLIVQAFKECPYNPSLLILTAQEHLLDKESFETIKPMLDPDSVTEILYNVMIKENKTLAENENMNYWRSVIDEVTMQALQSLETEKQKEAEEKVLSTFMRKKVSRQRKKRVVMQWRNRREQHPDASCSCISCCPTECLRHGAGGRRRALGRNCRQGRHPRPGCAYGSRG